MMMPVDRVGLLFSQECFVRVRMRVFGDHHDREGAAIFLAMAQQIADARNAERMLGYQNHISAAGDASIGGNPSGVAAHNFDDHNAMMRLSSRMQPIDSVGDNRYCRVEAECEISAADIVVNRLGNGDERKLMLLPKISRSRKR